MKKSGTKCIAFTLLAAIFNQVITPTVCWALTSGPALPETESFKPVSANDLVDLFTGDVSYNIPLMDVGGYPINLFYNGGVSMDQEASWVGFGWNLNVGSINRQMRGLPDDFKGDILRKDFNLKDNITYGVNANVDIQFVGIPFPAASSRLGVMVNNQKGIGLCVGANLGINSSSEAKGRMTANLGINFSSFDGASISANAQAFGKDMQANISGEVGSRTGLKSLNFSCTSLLQKATTFNPVRKFYSNSENWNGGADASAQQKEDASKAKKAKEAELGIESLDEAGKSYQIGNPASVSFVTPSYIPFSTLPMHNSSYSYSMTVGGEFMAIHPNLGISGYYSKQEVRVNKLISEGYGYIYSEHGRNKSSAIHDFNREKDLTFAKTIPVIGIPNYTYDLFVANVQGLSGQFRASRSDVGVLYDRSINSTNQSFAIGREIGFGAIFHAGANFTINETYNKLSKWTRDNNAESRVGFIDPNMAVDNNETVAFRLTGEMAPSNKAFISKVKSDSLMHIRLTGTSPSALGAFAMVSDQHKFVGYDYGNSKITRSERETRNVLWTYLSAEEAQHVGIDHVLKSHELNTLSISPCDQGNPVVQDMPRIDDYRKPHHISEVSILKESGTRYVFGIPTYNYFQKECTFSVNDQASNTLNCTYQTEDATINNNRGRDTYFASDSLPGFSNAFLLTGITSPDYVDRSNDGITMDDYGNAIKFNYTKLPYSFGFRTPFGTTNLASYNEGYEADDLDSKASYVYGRKELWYPHSIESNNYIIQFYLEDREDGLGALNEGGAIDTTARVKLLKEIRLYSKADVIQFGNQAIPIKTVHFVYDYSLCIDLPNNTQLAINNSAGSIPYYSASSNVNQGGKLTLRKIYFTYGSSTFGAINSYEFTYNDTPTSLPYEFGYSDRWGSYKTPDATLTNADYPYTSQDTSLTNTYVRYWMLNDIYLPSGGKIHIEYESDDYAYVQDKRAMQMFKIEGFSNNLHTTVPTNYNTQLYNGTTTYNYVYFSYPSTLGSISNSEFKKLFLQEIYDRRTDPYVYFKCKVDICNDNKYDYVNGYAKISGYGVIPGSNVGWLQLSNVEGDNPISSRAWLQLRQNLGQVAYPGGSNSSIGTAIVGLLASYAETISIFKGFSAYARMKNFGRFVIPDESFIRLCNPSYKKLGGGHRVKKVTMCDNWAVMDTTSTSSTYGQTYEYTTQEEVDGEMITISSGVASYEPMIGGDENPYRYPRNYEIKKKFGIGPTDHLYVEEPFGESLFPSASIGYSKVTVRPLLYSGVTRSKAGTTVNEFYTAFDFPISWNSTLLNSKDNRRDFETNFILKMFGFLPIEDYQGASQGFVVQTNDMHGRTRRIADFDANNQLISSTTYKYKQDISGNIQKQLSNNVPTVSIDGSISNQSLGIYEDMWTEMRQEETKSLRFGLQTNVDQVLIFCIPPFTYPITSIYPEFGLDISRFRSAALVKHIHRVGILDMIETVVEGASNFKQNLLFDGETGEPLLIASKNEFRDTIYNFHYPAHWMYSNMGQAYSNVGSLFKNVDISNGVHNNSAIDSYCVHGDELIYIVSLNTQPGKLWAVSTSSGIRLIDFNGKPVNLTGVTLKVVKSGRKNMISSTTGVITFLKDIPVDKDSDGSWTSLNLEKRVLDCTVTEFEHKWKNNCEQIPYSYTEPTRFSCDPPSSQCNDCCDTFFVSLDSIVRVLNYDIFHTNATNGSYFFNMVNIVDCNGWLQCNKEDQRVYSLNPTLNYSNHYELAIGNCCRVMIDGIDGEPFHCDSVTKFVPIGGCMADVYAYTWTDTTEQPPIASAYLSCLNSEEYICIDQIQSGDTINPFVLNMENNFHVKRTWAYNEKRTDLFDFSHILRDDGDYISFIPFWKYNSGIWDQDPTATRWVRAEETTAINKYGLELESKNALDISFSALYGFTESLVTAEAANSRYRNIAGDSFEDYYFPNSCLEPCFMEHWNFVNAIHSPDIFIADSISHSGLHSLAIKSGNYAEVYRDIRDLDLLPVTKWKSDHYELLNGCNYKFAPQAGKYVFSAWVKEDTLCNVLSYLENEVIISFTGSSAAYSFTPSGLIIEGWQQYYTEFAVPDTATGINVRLVARDNDVYFDDIRIQPFNSGMKTFVYNANNLRLMAVLDESNFATFYEYDEQGILIRTKKETERGIMTLNEFKRNLIRK